MKQPQLVAIAGAALMLMGAFSPTVIVGDRGPTNLLRGLDFTALLAVALPIAGFVLAFRWDLQRFRFVAGAALAFVLYQFGRQLWVMNALNEAIDLYNSLGDEYMDRVSLQFGWGLLFVGAGLMVASLFMKGEAEASDAA